MDPDDFSSRSPPLQPIKFKGSPTPEPPFLPPPARESPPPEYIRCSQGLGRMKVYPSQGYAVLINSMSNGNQPELAALAVNHPLDLPYLGNDVSVEESPVDLDKFAGQYGAPIEPVAVASNALRLVDGPPIPVEDRVIHQRHHETLRIPTKSVGRPMTPKLEITTQTTGHRTRGETGRPKAPIQRVKDFENHAGDQHPKDAPMRPGPPASFPPNLLNRRGGLDSVTPSSGLGMYAFPSPYHSPPDTLAPMQCSPPQSARSANVYPSLPPLREYVKVPERRPPTSAGGSVLSPPTELNHGHGPAFSSIQTRTNGNFYGHYTEPSPVSTLSESSRDSYRPGHDLSSMSPPGKISRHHMQSHGLTPQSESAYTPKSAQTPLSAESHPTSSSYSVETSPNGDRLSTDGDRPPPAPPPAAPSENGGFKCPVATCTAMPFQTQYLLKLVP